MVQALLSVSLSTVFVENVGQESDRELVFYTLHPKNLHVYRNGQVLAGDVLLRFGKPKYVLPGLKASPTINYMKAGKSFTGLPSYRQVILREAYEGVDVVLTTTDDSHVEVQFIVHPGADPGRISVSISDAQARKTEDGLTLKGRRSEILLHTYRAFQGADEVPVEAVLVDNTLSFRVGEYDPSRTLIIDPILESISTAIVAGTDNDYSSAIAMDSSAFGVVYIVGTTYNYANFSVSRNVFGTMDSSDVFVVKFRTNDYTFHHQATTIIGGSGADRGVDVAVGLSGNVYITGLTDHPSDFGPSRTTFGTVRGTNTFITELSGDLGTHLSTAIVGNVGVAGLALDASDNVYIAGLTSGFPASDTVGDASDTVNVFIGKFSSNLSTSIQTVVAGVRGSAETVGYIHIDGSTIYVSGSYANGAFGDDSLGDTLIIPKMPPPFYLMDIFLYRGPTSNLSYGSFMTFGEVEYNQGAGRIHENSAGQPLMIINGDLNYFSSKDSFVTTVYNYGSSSSSDGSIGVYNPYTRTLAILRYMKDALDGFGPPYPQVGLDIDDEGRVYVVGTVYGTSGLPSPYTIYGATGDSNVVLTVLSGDLSTHIKTVVVSSSGKDEGADVVAKDSCHVYITGKTAVPSNFSISRTIFGTTGNYDAFVSHLFQAPDACAIGQNDELGVSEMPDGVRSFKVDGSTLVLTLESPGYVGYDVYDLGGRRVASESVGYLPEGRYTFRLNLRRGEYFLRLRIGEKVHRVKILL